MKYYFLLPVMLVLSLAVAQSVTVQKPIECADTATLLQGLSGSDYKEKPIWWGIEPGATVSRYSLFVNEETKSWTLIQFDEKIACVLGTGDASTQIFNGPKI
jgi:hypothetical protein